MLKEMTLLMIVVWGSQGRPTTTTTSTTTSPSKEQALRLLTEMYCKAEELLRKYKSVDNKFLPPESRPAMESIFSQPGCNFTKSEEECRVLLPFHALFLWLKTTYPQEGLLKPVMDLFTLVIELQESHACLKAASHNPSHITCPKYSSDQPELENKFHYIFEKFRDDINSLRLSKLPEEQKNVADVCGSKD